MNILHCVNSFVNKPGNIGVRTGRILNALHLDKGQVTCICRGAQSQSEDVNYIEMGVLGHLPRILNAIRIYIAPGYDHRPADIALFEWFAMRHLPRVLVSSPGKKIAHVWDSCPQLISHLKQAGYYVLLDIPMAPSAYVRRLHQEGKAKFLPEYPRSVQREELAYVQADMLLAPSSFVKQELCLAGVDARKIRVQEFGCDFPEISNKVMDARQGRRDARSLKFCFAGNINRRKGINELLSAFSDPVFSNDQLHLCGRVYPEIRDSLAKACKGEMVMPGFISVQEYFKNCDIFVFPSWMEGSAKSVYEAMASGMPVITTESAGSVVRDGIDGFIVAAGDVESLKARMCWFKDNPGAMRTMGESARNRVKEFTWLRYAEGIIQIYDEICNLPNGEA
jgi:glycosyltransferase involved in cell wall biosynthesis